MKKLKGKLVLAISVILIFGFVLNSSAQENTKVEKAGSKFCKSVNNFVEAIGDLDAANGSGILNELTTAIKKTEKAWNKMEKSAVNLENIEIKESVKSYNKMVNAVNKILKSKQPNPEAAKQIDELINSTSNEINEILSGVCI